eukprot:CAMPEP_0114992982 /NCGR_PEP_ID=MMETSP0216-20121206/12260_1 /TAXON_ID=223996 /ORGANISM="Protocruzia adherens, Strain Boccale" /LENGTH=233 /DNA_ID=CAMNT_0002356541 /DNA_START=57 /DNA_END=758 /DNA_ORIENTATION=+
MNYLTSAKSKEEYGKSEENIRETTILMEYKLLQKHSPGGIYVMPEFENLRNWHGVIFVRNGIYKNAIYKFTMELPIDYPKGRPTVRFISKLFHPLIEENDGLLDLEYGFPEWRPGKDFIINILSFIKTVFYVSDYYKIDNSHNSAAGSLFNTDPEAFKKKVRDSIILADRKKYDNLEESSVKFTEYTSVHDKIKKQLFNDTLHEKKNDVTLAKDEFIKWFKGVFIQQLNASEK